MRTVADLKEFLLRQIGFDDWKDVADRDERCGGGYLLLHFWHRIHQLGNPECTRIREVITESDHNTNLSDEEWNRLWVEFTRLSERGGRCSLYPKLSDEELLESLQKRQKDHEDWKIILEQEWEEGEEVGVFWIHVSRQAPAFSGFLGGVAYDLTGKSHFNTAILAIAPEPPVGRWSEFAVRKAKKLTEDFSKQQLPIGKWMGKTKEGKFLLP